MTTLKNDIADIIYQGVAYSSGWQLEQFLAKNDCQDMADKIIRAMVEDTASKFAESLISMHNLKRDAGLLESWDSSIDKVDSRRGEDNKADDQQ